MAIRVPFRGDMKRVEADAMAAIRRIQKSAKIDFTTGANLKKLSQPLGRITGQANEFQKSMEASNARVIAFGASVAIINGVQNAFSEMVKTTIAVEKSLTRINAILRVSSDNLAGLRDNLFIIAKNTGQAFSEVAEAALDFSRQGLTMEETLKRTQAAMVLVRLEGLDAAKAVAGLTAAVNGFSQVGLEFDVVLNKMDAVSNRFAVSTKDLIEGVSRSAAVAKEAGVSFDQLISTIAVVQEKTARGGSVIGQAFKTIFTRVQSTDVRNALEGIGVATVTTGGKIRDVISILSDLGGQLDSLDDSSRKQILEKIAGKLRINEAAAFVTELANAENKFAVAVNFASKATDEAFKKNELYNKTVDSLIQRTKTAGQELANTFGQAKFVERIAYLIGFVNDRLVDFNSLLKDDNVTAFATVVKGIVKGFANFLSGPGLVIGFKVLKTLTQSLGSFLKDSLRDLTGINSKEKERKDIVKLIVEYMQQQPSLQKELNKLGGNRVEQAKVLVNLYEQQEQAQLSIYNTAKKLAPLVQRAGISPSKSEASKNAASGYLPMVQGTMASVGNESSAIRGGVGGAKSGDRPIVIPDFNYGGGKVGTIVANTGEHIVKNYGGKGGDAIFNRSMISQYGLPKGATPIAASGYVPNFNKPSSEDIVKQLIARDVPPNDANWIANKRGVYSFEVLFNELIDRYRGQANGGAPGVNALSLRAGAYGGPLKQKQVVDSFDSPDEKLLAQRVFNDLEAAVVAKVPKANTNTRIKSLANRFRVPKNLPEEERNILGAERAALNERLLSPTESKAKKEKEEVVKEKYTSRLENVEGSKFNKLIIDGSTVAGGGGIGILGLERQKLQSIDIPDPTSGKFGSFMKKFRGGEFLNRGGYAVRSIEIKNVQSRSVQDLNPAVSAGTFGSLVTDTLTPGIQRIAGSIMNNAGLASVPGVAEAIKKGNKGKKGQLLDAGAEGSILESAIRYGVTSLRKGKFGTTFTEDPSRPFDLTGENAAQATKTFKFSNVKAIDVKRTLGNVVYKDIAKKMFTQYGANISAQLKTVPNAAGGYGATMGLGPILGAGGFKRVFSVNDLQDFPRHSLLKDLPSSTDDLAAAMYKRSNEERRNLSALSGKPMAKDFINHARLQELGLPVTSLYGFGRAVTPLGQQGPAALMEKVSSLQGTDFHNVIMAREGSMGGPSMDSQRTMMMQSDLSDMIFDTMFDGRVSRRKAKVGNTRITGDLRASNFGVVKGGDAATNIYGSLADIYQEPNKAKSSRAIRELFGDRGLRVLDTGFLPPFRASGHLPLDNAVKRESMYSPMSSIRVGRDPRLTNRLNPMGLGVTNTIDEPRGMRDVPDARIAAQGYVPSFVDPRRINQKDFDAILSGGKTGGSGIGSDLFAGKLTADSDRLQRQTFKAMSEGLNNVVNVILDGSVSIDSAMDELDSLFRSNAKNLKATLQSTDLQNLLDDIESALKKQKSIIDKELKTSKKEIVKARAGVGNLDGLVDVEKRGRSIKDVVFGNVAASDVSLSGSGLQGALTTGGVTVPAISKDKDANQLAQALSNLAVKAREAGLGLDVVERESYELARSQGLGKEASAKAAAITGQLSQTSSVGGKNIKGINRDRLSLADRFQGFNNSTLALTFALPILSGIVQQGAFQNKKRYELSEGERQASSGIENFGNLVSTGSAVGSSFGPYGGAIGAVVGGVVALGKAANASALTLNDMVESAQDAAEGLRETGSDVLEAAQLRAKIEKNEFSTIRERDETIRQFNTVFARLPQRFKREFTGGSLGQDEASLVNFQQTKIAELLQGSTDVVAQAEKKDNAPQFEKSRESLRGIVDALLSETDPKVIEDISKEVKSLSLRSQLGASGINKGPFSTGGINTRPITEETLIDFRTRGLGQFTDADARSFATLPTSSVFVGDKKEERIDLNKASKEQLDAYFTVRNQLNKGIIDYVTIQSDEVVKLFSQAGGTITPDAKRQITELVNSSSKTSTSPITEITRAMRFAIEAFEKEIDLSPIDVSESSRFSNRINEALIKEFGELGRQFEREKILSSGLLDRIKTVLSSSLTTQLDAEAQNALNIDFEFNKTRLAFQDKLEDNLTSLSKEVAGIVKDFKPTGFGAEEFAANAISNRSPEALAQVLEGILANSKGLADLPRFKIEDALSKLKTSVEDLETGEQEAITTLTLQNQLRKEEIAIQKQVRESLLKFRDSLLEFDLEKIGLQNELDIRNVRRDAFLKDPRNFLGLSSIQQADVKTGVASDRGFDQAATRFEKALLDARKNSLRDFFTKENITALNRNTSSLQDLYNLLREQLTETFIRRARRKRDRIDVGIDKNVDSISKIQAEKAELRDAIAETERRRDNVRERQKSNLPIGYFEAQIKGFQDTIQKLDDNIKNLEANNVTLRTKKQNTVVNPLSLPQSSNPFGLKGANREQFDLLRYSEQFRKASEEMISSGLDYNDVTDNFVNSLGQAGTLSAKVVEALRSTLQKQSESVKLAGANLEAEGRIQAEKDRFESIYNRINNSLYRNLGDFQNQIQKDEQRVFGIDSISSTIGFQQKRIEDNAVFDAVRGVTEKDPTDFEGARAAALRASIDAKSFGRGLIRGSGKIEDEIINFQEKLGEDIPNLFASNMADALSGLSTGAASFEDAMLDAVLNISNALNKAFTSDLANRIVNSRTGNFLGISDSPVPYATGGIVKGGSGMRDDVPAVLTGGEYVVQKNAVRKYGPNFLDAVNAGQVPAFAGGGFNGSLGGSIVTGLISSYINNRKLKKQYSKQNEDYLESIKGYSQQKGPDFFVPGSTQPDGSLQGYISGPKDLQRLVDQEFTSGSKDRLSANRRGFSFALEDQSRRLSGGAQTGAFGNQIADEVIGAKGDALGLLFGYEEDRRKIKEDRKSKINQLLFGLGTNLLIGGLGAAFSRGKNFLAGTGLDSITGTDRFGNNIAQAQVIDENALAASLSPAAKPSSFVNPSNFFDPASLSTKPPLPFGDYDVNDQGLLPPRKYATGGPVDGPSYKDSMPALLMGGEYVMNRASVNKYGTGFMDAINTGKFTKFATGGGGYPMTDGNSRFDRLADALENKNEKTGTINININVETGEQNKSSDGNADAEQQLAERLETAVKRVIMEEQRAGGLLR